MNSAEFSAEKALEIGQRRLAQGDRDAATKALRQALLVPSTRLHAHNEIERFGLAGSFGEMMGLNCEISPADDIFRFFAGHPSSTNPLRDYFADGWRTLSELMLLLERVNRPLLQTRSFLEFASGHGRFTRHLVKALGCDRVTISDVVEDAVSFSRRAFGVQGFVSTAEPEHLDWPARYQLIFVLSLFSHLPRCTWSRWLRCLHEGLAPGGLLVLSTHGVKAAKQHRVNLDAEGFCFMPSSESSAISPERYGTTWTSEAFVKAQIEQQIGPDSLIHYQPHGFWNCQDAYVLIKQ